MMGSSFVCLFICLFIAGTFVVVGVVVVKRPITFDYIVKLSYGLLSMLPILMCSLHFNNQPSVRSSVRPIYASGHAIKATK